MNGVRTALRVMLPALRILKLVDEARTSVCGVDLPSALSRFELRVVDLAEGPADTGSLA